MNSNLDRFIKVQKQYYSIALSEIKQGKKKSHWMWFIFPQLKGLGMSATADYYGINGIKEAKEYYHNNYLKNNLIEISKTLLELNSTNIEYILGYPDNLKLKSCMTLFELVDSNEKVFKDILNKYYNGVRDQQTIKLIMKD